MSLHDQLRADLDAMYAVDDGWTEPAVYVSAAAGQIPVRVVVTENTEAVDPQTNAVILTQNPRARLPLHHLPGLPGSADRLFLRDREWRIGQHLTDAGGEVELYLEEA